MNESKPEQMRHSDETISMRARTPWTALVRDERGATAIEYALLMGLIFLAIISSVGTTGTGLSAKWIGVADTATSNLNTGQ